MRRPLDWLSCSQRLLRAEARPRSSSASGQAAGHGAHVVEDALGSARALAQQRPGVVAVDGAAAQLEQQGGQRLADLVVQLGGQPPALALLGAHGAPRAVAALALEAIEHVVEGGRQVADLGRRALLGQALPGREGIDAAHEGGEVLERRDGAAHEHEVDEEHDRDSLRGDPVGLRLLAALLSGHAPPDDHPAERPDADGDDRGADDEGHRIAQGEEHAAGAERRDGGDAARHRLGALGAAGDLVVDEVGGERAVGLVGHQVGGEEDGQAERGHAGRAHETQERQGQRHHRGGAEHEGQPSADRRAQAIGPRADEHRQAEDH
jgi:hypothetical protein